jgi:predicted DNA-binding protein (MmcQ/YjbR family)
MTATTPRAGKKAAAAIRAFALGFPGAYEDFPWGERVVKAAKKVFVFLGRGDGSNGFGLSVKLPHSAADVLILPFAAPTGYGLARGGWVTLAFEVGEQIPVAMLKRWIEESYRAVAPKALVKQLDTGAAPLPEANKPRRRR